MSTCVDDTQRLGSTGKAVLVYLSWLVQSRCAKVGSTRQAVRKGPSKPVIIFWYISLALHREIMMLMVGINKRGFFNLSNACCFVSTSPRVILSTIYVGGIKNISREWFWWRNQVGDISLNDSVEGFPNPCGQSMFVIIDFEQSIISTIQQFYSKFFILF